MQVSLSYHLITLLDVNILKLPSQVYASSLTHVHRFNYKRLVILLFVELRAEVSHLVGQYPRLREEIVLASEYLVHPHQVATQIILPGQGVHAWIVVDSLVGLQALELLWSDSSRVAPIYIPVCVLIVLHLES